MRALFDTNILLDIGLARKPYAKTSFACLAKLQEIGEFPSVAPHSLATFYYLLTQARGNDEAKMAVRDLIATCEVVSFDHESAQRSMSLGFRDFEDAMIVASAERAHADCIITRNGADFKKSPISALSPEDFLKVCGA